MYCQLYTCRYASAVGFWIALRRWIASCRMYTKACWYAAEASIAQRSTKHDDVSAIRCSVFRLVERLLRRHKGDGGGHACERVQ